MKYIIEVNCKYPKSVSEYDGHSLTLCNYSPINALRKLLPKFTIKKGNGWNWNIALWNKETGRHLYYTVAKEA